MKMGTVLKGIAIGVAAGAAIGGAAQVMNSKGRQIKRTAMRATHAAKDAADTFMDDMGF